MIDYSPDHVKYILCEIDSPIMESSLIKELENRFNYPALREDIYAVHFSLFFTLYSMKYIYGTENYYIHIDPMRLRMIKIPGEGFCSYYFPEEGRFCCKKTKEQFCIEHINFSLDNEKLSYDPLMSFYTNEENINYSQRELFEKMSAGIILYSLKKNELQNALKYFKLKNPTQESVKKRFHQLSKILHPDFGGCEEEMKKLNYYYGILKEVFVL